MRLYDSLLKRMDGHPYNGYFMSVCPFHDDHSPSLLVHENGYCCKACGARGSLNRLERKIGQGFRSFRLRDTVSFLPRWKSWEREYGDLEGVVDFAHNNLLKNAKYKKYYENRKCDGFIEEGRLGFISPWAVVPVFDRSGDVVDVVVRSTSERTGNRYVIAPSGNDESRPLYVPNWKRVMSSDVVYVTLGIFDAISFELCGLPAVTGITGKSVPIELLLSLQKRFIIVPDRHEESDAHRIANSLGWRCRVKELQFPEGTKDPDDIRRIYGNSFLKEMINEVESTF